MTTSRPASSDATCPSVESPDGASEGSSTPGATAHRFYTELARFWPLISPVEDYLEEGTEFTRVIKAALPEAQTVLELGSGGGHNAFHMKRSFQMTLTDLSEAMLAVSMQINPECEHHAGDMRQLELGREFDVVFIHDAIDYMTTEAALATALATAYRHCRPGGIALIVPDALQESFESSTECGGNDGPAGEGIRYLEWSYVSPTSEHTGITHYTFVAREADGSVNSFTESHHFGLFPQATWLRLLQQTGFRTEVFTERTEEDRTPRLLFVGRR